MPIKVKKIERHLDPRDEFQHLREKLRIDKNNLDEECILQPVLYQELSEHHVFAQGERDAAKEKLQAVDAKVAHGIRVEWTKSGEKFAETKVGDAVQLDPRHVDAFTEWSRLNRRAAYLNTLVMACEQRGKMLKELAGLYISGYFDRVISKRGERDASGGKAAAAREAMRQRRNRDKEND